MAVLSWPSAGHYDQLLTSSGVPLANASYDVYLSDGSTPATIYTDKTKANTRSQPLTTDSAGNAEFYTDPYSGLVLQQGSQTRTIDVLPDVSDLVGTNIFSDGGSHSSYTLSGADNLKDLAFLAGTPGTQNCPITVPNNLPKNFSCRVLHEGGGGDISFVAASGTTLNCFGVTSGATTVWHPGPFAWVDLTCRFNGSGTAADVVIGNGIANAPS